MKIDEVVGIKPAPPPPPEVGILWCFRLAGSPTLLWDSVQTDYAERYGDFQTYGAHAEYWDKLAAMPPHWLKSRGLWMIRSTEYDEWPRGRVVFNRETDRFTLYADSKLQTPTIIWEIRRWFHLPADRLDVRRDEHYRS